MEVRKQRASAGVPIRPLQIITSSMTTVATETEPAVTTNYLSLYPGTIGGIYPKVNNHPLWAMPSDGAGGFLQYPRMSFNLPAEGSQLSVWMKVRCVAGSVVSAECEVGVSTEEAPLPPANTAEYAYVLLGFINPNGSVVQQTYGPLAYQLVFGLQSGQPFGHTFTFAP